MTYRPTVLGCMFLILGLVLAGCEVLGVYEYVTTTPTGLYVAVGSCVVAGLTPALPALADWAWRGRWFLWSLASWLVFFVCVLFVMLAAIQRTGAATDGAQQSRVQAERAMAIAEEAERQAKSDYEAAQSASLKECADGRKTRCMDAEAKAERLRNALAKARADLVRAPAGKQSDALATRIMAISRLSEEQIRLLQPLQLPIILSVLSALLFCGWGRLDFTEAKRPPPSPVSGQIILEAPIPAPKPRLALVPKSGAVAAYIVSRTEPADGASIEIERDMYGDYKRWCELGNVEPYPPRQFAKELGKVVEATGLLIEIRGAQAFCMDRKLAA